MAVSFANVFTVKIETTLIQQSETKPKNQRPVTHLLSQNSPPSKMADRRNREAWALRTNTPTSTEEAHPHGGGPLPRRKLLSMEEADFYGGD